MKQAFLALVLATSSLAADDAAALAKQLVLPRAEFKDAAITEVIQWLEVRSKALDPEGKGVKFYLENVPGSKTYRDEPVNLELSNVSVFDVATAICRFRDVQLVPQKETLLFKVISREQLPPRIGDESKIEGVYTTPPDLSGASLVLKNGRFEYYGWSDVSPGKKGETGAYKREGRRIILIGDKSDFIDNAVWAEYDGVPLLFTTTGAYRSFVENGVISRDTVLHRAWEHLAEHPKLAAKLGGR